MLKRSNGQIRAGRALALCALLASGVASAQVTTPPLRIMNGSTTLGLAFKLKFDGTTISCTGPTSGIITCVGAGGGGSGTVTSIAMGSGINSTQSPLTTSGTLSIDTTVVATTSNSLTMTNKTLTAPVLGGSVTGTYTLAGTPTITSPTISGPTFSGSFIGTYSIAGTPSLAASLTMTTATYAIGDTTHLLTALATARLIGGASNTVGHLVPNLADDTIALLTASQTFTNKTITSPVLSGTVTGTWSIGGTPSLAASLTMTTATYAIGDTTHLLTALATAKLIGGSSNTNGHTVPNVADDTVALIAAAQTFTNKTVTSPVLSGTSTGTWSLGGTPSLAASLAIATTATYAIGDTTHLLTALATPRLIGGSSNTSGHLVPNLADDTIALLAATQTFTNKTITAAVLSGTATGTYTLGGTPTIASPTMTGVTTSPHYSGNGTAPGIAGSAPGAGTGPTVSVTGNDVSGTISVTTGSSTSNGPTVATITFTAAYATAPTVLIYPATANAMAIQGGVNGVWVDPTATSTTTFVIRTGTGTLANTTAYKWVYHVIQ